MCVRACMRVHACACVHAWDTPPHTYIDLHPHPSIHHPLRGDCQNQLKFDNTWSNRDISIPFEDLKSVKNFPPMGGCIVGGWVGAWVGWWVGSGQNTKNFKNVDWIKIIQFCLKIHHLLKPPTHGWVGGWLGGSVGFDLTPPIDPLTHPTTHTPTHGWGCLNKWWIFNQNWIISIRSRFIQLLVIWLDPTHWPTDPPNHPHTHPWWGCLNKWWIFKQNWIISIRSRFIQLLVIWLDPTHWPTDPPNHPHTHPWVGVSQQMIYLETELNYFD